MISTGTAELYLAKAREAEEAGKWAVNDELREAWLEIAEYYRLLAARKANAEKPRPVIAPL